MTCFCMHMQFVGCNQAHLTQARGRGESGKQLFSCAHALFIIYEVVIALISHLTQARGRGEKGKLFLVHMQSVKL